MMRVLFFSSLCLLFVSVLWFLPDAQAANTSYYTVPNGSGSSCTRQSPCSLQAALDRAGSGNEIVLKDGTYYSTLFTKRPGVTIRAENTRKAVVKPPRSGWNPGKEGSSQGDKAYVRITHDNTTLRGIVFDGDNRRTFQVLNVDLSDNSVIENNVFKSSEANLVDCKRSSNVIFRHNLLEDSNTEGMYCGMNETDPKGPIRWQIYGNIFRNIGVKTFGNSIDLKPTSRNVEVHHNIFEGNKRGSDGCLQVNSIGHKVHDNIIRNIVCGTAIMEGFGSWAGQGVYNNVMYNIKSQDAFWHQGPSFSQSAGYGPSQFRDNTLCNTPSSVCRGKSCPSGVTVTNNRFNVSQSDCDAEANRIIDEMKNLANVGDGTTPLPRQLQPPVLGFPNSNVVAP